MILITSHNTLDKAIHAASVVLRALKVCILDAQMIRHLACMITYPICEWAGSGSLDEQSCNEPAQSASTQHSKPQLQSSFKISPSSLALSKYEQILLTASS